MSWDPIEKDAEFHEKANDHRKLSGNREAKLRNQTTPKPPPRPDNREAIRQRRLERDRKQFKDITPMIAKMEKDLKLQTSLPTPSRYHSLPVEAQSLDGESSSTSISSQHSPVSPGGSAESTDRSSERDQFYQKFTQRIKPRTDYYINSELKNTRDMMLHGRRMSRVALKDQSTKLDYKLGDVLWLNLQTYLHGMPMKGAKQKHSTKIFDGTLLKKQQEMQFVLHNIRDFCFNSELTKDFNRISIDAQLGTDSEDDPSAPASIPSINLTTEYLDAWAEMYLQVGHLLQQFERLRELYPSHDTMAKMQKEIHHNELQENRINVLYLWFNQSTALARRLYDIAVMMNVEQNDSGALTWPFLNVHNFRDLQAALALDDDNEAESDVEDTSNGSPMSISRDRSSTSELPDPADCEFRKRSLSCFPKSSYTELYESFVQYCMCHKGVRHELKRLHRMTAPILLKVQHSLRKCKPPSASGTSPRLLHYNANGIVVNLSQHSPLQSQSSRPIPLTPRSTHIQNFMPKSMDFFLEMQCGESNPEFSRMNLLTLRPMALFLLRISVDVVHEWIRYTISEKCTEKPDIYSLDSLITESHECLRAAVEVKTYYQEFVQSTTTNDAALTVLLIDDLHDFEQDLIAMFDVGCQFMQLYLNYVSSWINNQTTQDMDTTTEWWQEMTKKLEKEWRFAKRIAISVVGGESQAAKMFCNFGESMFKQMSSERLVQRYQQINSELFDDEDLEMDAERVDLPGRCTTCEYDTDIDHDTSGGSMTKLKQQRSVVLSMCRETKKIIRDVRERSVRALGFGKLLTNDMEIAARFTLNADVSTQQLLAKLLKEEFVMVTAQHTSGLSESPYAMFCEPSVSSDTEHLLLLLNVTCGRDKHEVPKHLADKETYLLLVQCDREDVQAWAGNKVHVNPDPDTQMSLQYMQVDGVYMVVVNSTHLTAQCRSMMRKMHDSLNMVEEQCSCHELIADQMENLKDKAFHHKTVISEHIDQMTVDLLDGQDFNSLMSTERHSYRDTLIQAYNFAFEYYRELSRFAPSRRVELAHDLHGLVIRFTRFVMSKFARGHKSFPKWAQPSFGFMQHASMPQFTNHLDEGEYTELKNALNACVDHIIGDFSTASVDRSQNNDTNPSIAGLEKSSSFEEDFQTIELIDRRHDIALAVADLDAKLYRSRVERKFTGREVDMKTVKPSQHFQGKRAPFKWQRMDKKIGEGKFGRVYQVLNLNTNQMLAMKELDRRRSNKSETDIQVIVDEYRTLEGVNHPNLVKFYGIEEHVDRILIFMELCNEGTLEKVCRQGLDKRSYREYTQLLLKGLQHLHKANIIHRDIKPANIFLCSGPERLKLGDFGCSTRLADSGTAIGQLTAWFGSPCYMAPEVLRSGRSLTDIVVGYGRAADMWSIGCTVLEMVTGKSPWHEFDNNIALIVYNVGQGTHPPIPKTVDTMDTEFLFRCFEKDDQIRWTVDQALQHSFCRILARQESLAPGHSF